MLYRYFFQNKAVLWLIKSTDQQIQDVGFTCILYLFYTITRLLKKLIAKFSSQSITKLTFIVSTRFVKEPKTIQMQQFEYKTFNVPLKNALFSKKQNVDLESIEDELNLLGKKGWELTTQFTRQKNGFSQYAVLIFKRPTLLAVSKTKA